MKLARSKRQGLLVGALNVIALLLPSPALWAADSVTATKTRNPDATYSSGGVDTFTIATNQTVKWIANYNQAVANEGNDFYLHESSQAQLNQIALSTNLPLGMSSGEQFLNAGTWRISTPFFGMGQGSYTIEFNRTASIALAPSTHNFGSVLTGQASPSQTFTVSSTGDLPVTITTVTISDPAHFEVVGAAPSGTAPDTFGLRCVGGATPGTFGATISVAGTNSSATVSPTQATATCTVLAPVPNIACSGNPNLGTADWTTSQTINVSRSYENQGTAQLAITSVQIVNLSPLAPFALVGAPTLAPLGPGGSRSVAMTFTAPNGGGEATYSGQVRIDSNDPDEPVKLCSFQARAHHPEPRMILASTLLDYHQVELGFAFTKGIVVSNAGDASLSLTVADVAPLDADAPQWSLRETAATTVVPGGEAVFRQVYEPQALGIHQMQMRVSGNDPTNPEQLVTLDAEAIPPIPIDSVLALDRSGSMSDSAGSAGTKLSALKRAAGLYTDLVAQRSDGLPAANADKLGLVEYNNANSELLALDAIQGSHVNNAHAGIDGLTATGATGIGGAIQRAGGMLVSSPADRKHVLVVMTDGKENVDPRIGTVVPTVRSADPLLRMYSVSVGNDIEADKLQAITNVTNGYHQVADDLSGTSVFDLETFYFKIFANATEMELVIDPTVPINLNTLSPIEVARAAIVSSDHSVTFLVLDIPALRPFYALDLVSSTGAVIVPGAAVGGVAVHELNRDTYRLVRVVFPSLALSGDYVGDWILRLTPKGYPDKQTLERLRGAFQPAPGDPAFNPAGGIVPVGFAAAVTSDYKMAVAATASGTAPGSAFMLTASFSDRGWPSPTASAKVTITAPGGATYGPVALYDDGSHGDLGSGDATFTSTFGQTGAPGTYKVFFQGLGQNERGELAPREATRYVTLVPPQPPGGGDGGECIPCRLLRWLWAVVIALLLLGLLCCYRKGRG